MFDVELESAILDIENQHVALETMQADTLYLTELASTGCAQTQALAQLLLDNTMAKYGLPAAALGLEALSDVKDKIVAFLKTLWEKTKAAFEKIKLAITKFLKVTTMRLKLAQRRLTQRKKDVASAKDAMAEKTLKGKGVEVLAYSEDPAKDMVRLGKTIQTSVLDKDISLAEKAVEKIFVKNMVTMDVKNLQEAGIWYNGGFVKSAGMVSNGKGGLYPTGFGKTIKLVTPELKQFGKVTMENSEDKTPETMDAPNKKATEMLIDEALALCTIAIKADDTKLHKFNSALESQADLWLKSIKEADVQEGLKSQLTKIMISAQSIASNTSRYSYYMLGEALRVCNATNSVSKLAIKNLNGKVSESKEENSLPALPSPA